MNEIIKKWSYEEECILIEYFPKVSNKEIEKMLPKKTIHAIRNRARVFELKKNKSYMQLKKNIDKSSLLYVFSNYKKLLTGKTNRKLTENINHIPILFKYYLKKNNISTDRDFIVKNYIIGSILKEAKLKTFVKKNFNGYYEFMKYCFPLYNFKEWEFKNLDVSEGFWDKTKNCFECIEHSIETMKKDKIIDNDYDVLTLTLETLRERTHKTMIYKHGKSIFVRYLNHKKINYKENEFRFYDGYHFDSFEEKQVYREIKNMGLKIEKLNRRSKIFNKDKNEYYIPDFLIDGEIYLEYYGLYNSTNYFGNYKEKTDRKNEFYRSNHYSFIAIYPEDLKSNSLGLKNKINNYKIAREHREVVNK